MNEWSKMKKFKVVPENDVPAGTLYAPFTSLENAEGLLKNCLSKGWDPEVSFGWVTRKAGPIVDEPGGAIIVDENSMATVELWVKASEVRIGDVMLKWRTPGDGTNDVRQDNQTAVKSFYTTVVLTSFFVGSSGEFSAGKDSKTEWYVRRTLGKDKPPPLPVATKPGKCVHCWSSRCSGTCVTVWK